MSYRRDVETGLTQQNANLSVKQTLAQQIQITERDIAIRKKMLGLTKTHEKSLTKAKEIAYQNVNQIVENFYVTQLEHSEISLLIGDLHSLMRLKNSMRGTSLICSVGFMTWNMSTNACGSVKSITVLACHQSFMFQL